MTQRPYTWDRHLRVPVAQGVVCHLIFEGQVEVTQAAIDMLIKHLELARDAFPMAREQMQEAEESEDIS